MERLHEEFLIPFAVEDVGVCEDVLWGLLDVVDEGLTSILLSDADHYPRRCFFLSFLAYWEYALLLCWLAPFSHHISKTEVIQVQIIESVLEVEVLTWHSKRIIVIIIEGNPDVFIVEWVLVNLTILDMTIGLKRFQLHIEYLEDLLSGEDD